MGECWSTCLFKCLHNKYPLIISRNSPVLLDINKPMTKLKIHFSVILISILHISHISTFGCYMTWYFVSQISETECIYFWLRPYHKYSILYYTDIKMMCRHILAIDQTTTFTKYGVASLHKKSCTTRKKYPPNFLKEYMKSIFLSSDNTESNFHLWEILIT